MINAALLFWLMLKASLLSSGGLGNLASLHQDLLARGWADDHAFAQALAIGQLSPGPTGLWVIALGYLIFGLAGSTLAMVAVLIPPLLVIPIGLVHHRYAPLAPVQGFVRGLALAVTGSVPVVVLKLAGSYGIDLVSLAIVIGSAALIATRRVPVIAVLVLGGAIGAAFYH